MPPSTASPTAALQVFRPDGPEVDRPLVIDFARQAKVAAWSAFEARTRDEKIALLAFGYPGNGKTAFSRNLAREFQVAGFYVAWVDCLKVSNSPSADVYALCAQLRLLVESPETRPLLIVASVADALWEAANENPELAKFLDELESEVRSLEYAGQVVLLATAKSPTELVGRLYSARLSMIYFPWPSDSDIAALLSQLNVPQAKDVATSLLAKAGAESSYTTGRIVKGVLAGRQTFSDFEELASERIADVLSYLCLPTSQEDEGDYVERNQPYIIQAAQAAAFAEERIGSILSGKNDIQEEWESSESDWAKPLKILRKEFLSERMLNASNTLPYR